MDIRKILKPALAALSVMAFSACGSDPAAELTTVIDFDDLDIVDGETDPVSDEAFADTFAAYTATHGVTFSSSDDGSFYVSTTGQGWGLGTCDDAEAASGFVHLAMNTGSDGTSIIVEFDPPVHYVGAPFGANNGEDGTLVIYDADGEELDSVTVSPDCPAIDEDSVISAETDGDLIYKAEFIGPYIVIDDLTFTRWE